MERSRSPRYSDRSDYEDDEAAPSSSSPPPVREDGFQYDVFLSFRGPDTRKGFTSHLYQALQDKGIHTFIDSRKLEKGQKVKELFGYIERSKIFVPIFSKGYADSEWCLKEITKMVECKRLVIPVFFDVEPRDVRGQSGPFELAFTRYSENGNSNKEEVRKWRNALIEAGEVSRYTLANNYVDEATQIKSIVKRILTEVNMAPLFIGATHPIGLDSRIAELVEVLEVEAQNVAKMVGIHGMGGIGKTTLARAVYNQICPHFDGSSFISDVREAAKQSKLVSLQEQLLRDVFKDEKVKVNDTAHGTGMIMRRIKSKKVLLVLDNVDSESQLGALASSVDWFCFGSRIIITTRDKQVLRASGVKESEVYELKELNPSQSLQLFSWHAFRKEEPLPESAKLSKEVANTAAGLPLALKVFGSHFFYLQTNKERENMLKKLKKDLHKDIHERLKISFDGLDEEEKTVFLDIACFFVGKERNFATFKWEDCGLFPDLIIKFLMHKSLININEYTGEFEMHDHIRDMGRKIVEDESRLDPGMRSRLWKKDDIQYVLQNKRGTEKIEAIDISCLSIDSKDVDTESFAGMSQLRMLQLGNVPLTGEYGHIPRTLKWLKWNPGYFDILPSTLPLENIVVLDLSGSSITQVWNDHKFTEAKVFGQLKVLNLRECKNLTICPDFMCMPYIEKLNFSDCEKLTELYPSIGHLKSLTHLCLTGCESLKELPEGVWQLTSLEALDICECYQITTLSSQLWDSKLLMRPLLGQLKVMNLCFCKNLTICPDFTCMPYIENLDFTGCEKLTELHPSIGCLKSMTYLSVRGCESLKELPEGVWQLTSLVELDVSRCSQITTLSSHLMDSKSVEKPLFGKLKVMNLCLCENLTICPDFTCMPNVEKLNFQDCANMTELHPSIGHLKSLTHLSLRGCKSIKELPEGVWQLTSLVELNVSYCSQITTLSSQLMDSKSLERPLLRKLKVMDLYFCKNLTICPDFTCMPYIENLYFTGCEKLIELHPSVGHLKSLAHLSLRRCESLKELPEGVWQLTSLVELNVSENFTICPDFTCMPYIERLDFEGCEKLTELHPSIGHLKSLTHLSLRGCESLKELPEGVWQLTLLEELNLSMCYQITALPSQLMDSKSVKPPLLGKLKVMDLSFCRNLIICPDFTCMPYIENLYFKGCEKLTKLHPSIGHLKSLTHLSLRGCESLKELPEGVWQLTSLVELNVSCCSQITTLSSQLMDSKSLELPLLGKLKVMDLYFCKNPTICPDFTCMPYIEKLYFKGCEKLTELHKSIGHLKSLTHLCLRGCKSLKELPEGVWQLTSLVELNVSHCSQITTLSSQLMDSKSLELPLHGKLKVMDLYFCKNLTICPDFTCMPYIEKLYFTGCEKLTELHKSIGHLKSLTHLCLRGCKSLKELPEGVWQLTSLVELNVSYCSQITTLSSQLMDSKSLEWPLLGKLKVMNFYC